MADHFNLLGKVDQSRTIITPNEYIFRFKEAARVPEMDYQTFRAKLLESQALEANRELIEKEKEKQFQAMFQQMWPNLHAKLNPPPPPPAPTLTELERRIQLNNLLLSQDLERQKAAAAAAQLAASSATKDIKISIDLNNPSNKLEISSTPYNSANFFSTSNPAHSILVNPAFHTRPSCTTAISSYDFPTDMSKFNHLVTSTCYDASADSKLLAELKEAQEKLKYAQRLEKTTDVVDNIIRKVENLQDEMKRKTEMIKIEKSIETLAKERENRLLRCSLASAQDQLIRERLSRSRETVCVDETQLLSHHHHHHHHCRSKSREERARSKSPKPLVSILKHRSPSISYTIRRTPSVVSISGTGSDYESETSLRRSRSKLCKCRSKNSVAVGPRVDCWNCNCAKVDTNVY